MKKLFLSLFIAFAMASNALYAQTPSISWSRCYGGGWSDFGYTIHQTSDGGYIAGGMSRSLNGDVVPAGHGSYDVWILKLSATGSVEWQKSLGGSLEESTYNIIETRDGGYVFAGITNSSDGQLTGATGSGATWLVKLSGTGNILWHKRFWKRAVAICHAPDGGFMLAGNPYITGWGGYAWAMRVDSTGDSVWQRTFTGVSQEYINDIQPAIDGGYLLAGTSFSDIGFIPGNHGGGDAIIIKLSDTGGVVWQYCIGGTALDNGMSVCQGRDSVIFLASNTESGNGDAAGSHGSNDILISAFSPAGTHLWSKPVGSSAMDIPYSIRPYGDSGAVIAGISKGNDFDMHKNNGLYDYWVGQISSGGILQWQNSFGGTTEDSARYCEQTSDGGIIVIGSAFSANGDIVGNHGQYDIWVAKLGGTTAIETVYSASQYGITINSAGNLLISGPQFDKAVVYDIAGRVILTEHSSTVPTHQLPHGTYLLAVYRNDGSPAFSSGFTR